MDTEPVHEGEDENGVQLPTRQRHEPRASVRDNNNAHTGPPLDNNNTHRAPTRRPQGSESLYNNNNTHLGPLR